VGVAGHAMHFSNKGYRITGIDRSEEMIEVAKSKQIPDFTAIVGDITDYSINSKFDCIVSLFHVVSYVNDNKSLIECMKLANNHLNQGGLFLFDVWYSPAVLTIKPEKRIKCFENERVKVERTATTELNYNTNVAEVNFRINIHYKEDETSKVFNEVHPMRYFSLPELELLAEISGFDLVDCEELLTKEKPGENTWAVCVIFQKKN
jgi:SAM-dependent methyltransferase